VDDALPPSPPPPEPPQSASEPAPAQPTLAQPAPILSAPVLPETIPPQPAYTDRSAGLLIFGIIQIILGLLAALMIPFAMLGAFMSRLVPGGASMRPGQVVSAVVTYAVIAAAFIAVGIGSVQTKRWARALTLVTSWYGLGIGTLTTIFMTAALPVSMRGFMAEAQRTAPNPSYPGTSAGIPTAVMAIIVTLIILFVAFFAIVVPLAFVIFYGRKDVELTCHYRDPVERWTDRTPLPVLGASVFLTVGAFFFLTTALTTPLFPFFGRYVTGIAGAVGLLAFAALDVYLAVALFRLRSVAWWITIVAAFLRILSMAITYARADLMQAYSKLGFSESELHMLNATPLFRSHIILWWGLLSSVLFCGYLIFLKRYFKPPMPSEGGLAAPPL